jgi:hypothetical protein
MARRRRRSRDPFIRQAELESVTAYGPEQEALRELLREARYALKSGISAEKATARGIQRAIEEAQPEMLRA